MMAPISMPKLSRCPRSHPLSNESEMIHSCLVSYQWHVCCTSAHAMLCTINRTIFNCERAHEINSAITVRIVWFLVCRDLRDLSRTSHPHIQHPKPPSCTHTAYVQLNQCRWCGGIVGWWMFRMVGVVGWWVGDVGGVVSVVWSGGGEAVEWWGDGVGWWRAVSVIEFCSGVFDAISRLIPIICHATVQGTKRWNHDFEQIDPQSYESHCSQTSVWGNVLVRGVHACGLSAKCQNIFIW